MSLTATTRGQSKLFGISLKDRAAILTSGHASDGAFWLDHDTGHFVSSTYWGPKMPEWAEAFNRSGRVDEAIRHADVVPGHFYDDVGSKPESVSYLLDFAQALMEGEKMGRHEVTDVLTISISSTDILGHKVGPDAPEQRAMIDAIDVELNRFFGWVDKHVDGGMANVWVSLTGDHGIGPTLEGAGKAGMPAATFSLAKVVSALEAALNARYSPGQTVKYVLPSELPYVTLDPRAFAGVKVSEEDAENAVAEMLPAAFVAAQPTTGLTGAVRLPTRALLRKTYTKTEMKKGQVPDTPEGKLIVNSYSPNGGWQVMMTPGMYEQAATGTNHYTPYSYDRHVPLGFFGGPFAVGTYHEMVAPVDIAATFASLLRVNRPSAAVGRVLTFALKPGQ